jgi:hypothetical protein
MNHLDSQGIEAPYVLGGRRFPPLLISWLQVQVLPVSRTKLWIFWQIYWIQSTDS